MSSRAKKLTVLHHLSQEAVPISLKDLIQKLGNGYVERSVRRWLQEMIAEGLVEKEGEKRGSKYRVVERAERRMDAVSQCFSSASEKAIARIRRPIYERPPVIYADEWVEAYHPNESYYLSASLREQLAKAGKRSKRADPAGTYAHQIFNRLLIDLSYNSSRLEGNTYSLLDTQKLVLEGASAEGKLDEEKIMILNHKEAIRYLINNAQKLEINVETLCVIHFLLSDGLVEPQFAGKIRNHSVKIGGSVYIPFEDVKALQLRLERIMAKAALIEDSYEQSLFLLAHVSYLQAFTDVNKRTARLSANISLIKNNLVPLSFNDVERDDYHSAMIAVYEIQDIRPLIDIYLFSYMRTCAQYDSTVNMLGFDEIRVRYRQQRRALISAIILQKMREPALTRFITEKAAELVKAEDKTAFIEDIFEDLREICPSRIAGLGITEEQLNEWLIHKL